MRRCEQGFLVTHRVDSNSRSSLKSVTLLIQRVCPHRLRARMNRSPLGMRWMIWTSSYPQSCSSHAHWRASARLTGDARCHACERRLAQPPPGASRREWSGAGGTRSPRSARWMWSVGIASWKKFYHTDGRMSTNFWKDSYQCHQRPEGEMESTSRERTASWPGSSQPTRVRWTGGLHRRGSDPTP